MKNENPHLPAYTFKDHCNRKQTTKIKRRAFNPLPGSYLHEQFSSSQMATFKTVC